MTPIAKTEKHKWTFRARFRRHAFGWRSQPAIKRVKEAVSEIKKVALKEKVLAAEGAVLFLEKVSPALEHVDRGKYLFELHGCKEPAIELCDEPDLGPVKLWDV